DLFTSRMIRDKLHHAESLAGKELDLNVVTKVLTSIKGVTLTADAAERLTGKVRVDFGESPSVLKSIAKPLIFEILESQGMMLDEMKDWAILVEAKAITLDGRMTTKGLRKLTDLIPFPVHTLELQKAEPNAGGTTRGSANGSSSTEDMATTSKKYFQHISLLIDQLKTDLKSPNVTPKIAQRMVDKAALEIDRLPVLNVDEEVLAY